MVMNPSQRSAIFTCWPGHRFSDGSHVKEIECNHDNSWDYSIGHCGVNVCEELVPPPNATLVMGAAIYNSIARIQCQEGFAFDDGDLVKTLCCLDSGKWNDTIVSDCEPVFCPPPPLMLNASYTAGLDAQLTNDQFPYGATVSSECFDGLKFPDGWKQWTISCGGTGTWNATDSSCESGRCDLVPSVDHAVANSTSANVGTVVGYTCEYGYKIDDQGSSVISCNGISWMDSPVQCTEIRCPYMIQPNGLLNTTNNLHETRLLVSCYHGYQINSQPMLVATCMESGKWSPEDTCTAVECGPVPVVMNSQMVSSGSMTYGTNVTITCLHGYWFARNVVAMTISCGADGNWTDLSFPICRAVSCPSLAPRILSTTNTEVETVVNVSCPADQILTTGQMTAVSTCNAFGHWTPDVPDCIGQKSMQLTHPPVESSYSNVFGGIAIFAILMLCVAIIVFDISRLRNAVKIFKRRYVRAFHPESNSSSR